MRARAAGFTIVELLVVMAIILVLAGLVLATSGYVHNKAARSRAEAEIAAMSAALENYKADSGVYPDAPSLDPRMMADPTQGSYQPASLILYKNLTGDMDADRATDSGARSYISFKDNQLSPATGNVQSIRDSFGYSYGYSTAYAAAVAGGNSAPTVGFNPTFDLWSTAGATTTAGQAGWVKNW